MTGDVTNPVFCVQILCLQFHPTTWSLRRSLTWRCWFYAPIRITNSRFSSSPINPGVLWSLQIARTGTYATCWVVVGSRSFGWHMPTKRPLCLFYQGFRDYRAIGAIRWNEPLNHSGTVVWRRVHSRFLFGCQSRPSRVRRSGTRFQCWLDSRQCSGISCSTFRAPLPELNFAAFGNMSVTIDDATMPRDADCTRPHSTRKQSVDCRHKVLSPKPTDWGALVAIPMSHFLPETGSLKFD